ncbi:MAG: DUF3822 family protein [Bacteroidales bacterium]|nr:DUF3822 family protein [Bacteroidales bacterium]
MSKAGKANLIFSYADNTPIDEAECANLSVRWTSDGFCLLLSLANGKVILLHQYGFVDACTIEEQLLSVQSATKNLFVPYKEHLFVVYTQLNTQIPKSFYVPDDNVAISALLTEKHQDYKVIATAVEAMNLYNLSLIQNAVNQILTDKFSAYQIYPSITGLLTEMSRRKNGKEAFIFVDNSNFTLMAGESGNLLAANTFHYNTEDDFVYYLLSFMRQISDKFQSIPLSLAGNITADSSICRSVKKFFEKVDFLTVLDRKNAHIDNEYCFGDILSLL